MLILAELHDFRRFASAPALMAYLGLVPGEDSSGEKHRRGRITRTGKGSSALGGNSVALSTSSERRRRIDAAAQGTTGACDCDCGQGAAAAVPTIRKMAAEHKPA